MTERAPPGQGKAERPSLRGAVARLSGALVGLFRTRLTLASVEYAEERARVGRQLALLVAAIGCLLFALLFAAGAVVIFYWDSYRLEAVIGVAVAFAVAAGLLLWRRAEVEKTSPTPFAATIAELDKDRAAIARLRAPEPDRPSSP